MCNEVEKLQARIVELEAELIREPHFGIHERDKIRKKYFRLVRLIEDNVLVNLKSISVANSRKPPKVEVVGIKTEDIIDDCIEVLEKLRLSN